MAQQSQGIAFGQFLAIVRHGLLVDFLRRQRLFSPLLFAATVLIMFSVAIGQLEARLIPKVYLAQLFLTALFALQTSLGRVFDPDASDGVFELLRTYPISRAAWYFGKWLVVFVQSITIALPSMAVAAIFNQDGNQLLLELPIAGLLVLAVACLCSLGVLLAGLTLQARDREILFPILYFPLNIPVLIAAVQAGNSYYFDPPEFSTFGHWAGLLPGFAVIYTTLGYLLFGELVD
jgi:heme exporter protein B